MIIQHLSIFPEFPDPKRDDVDDLLAIGGDLSPERLVAAYQKGIFPWFDETSPILWWSPDPRLILRPANLHVTRRLSRTLRQGRFCFTVNMDFAGVISGCAEVPRHGVRGTWIVPEMIEAYTRLHVLGYAHSVEVLQEGRLVGGIYGVALGRAFFGESMFHLVTDASKGALVVLVRLLESLGYHFMDCQQTTQHLLRFGAIVVPRKEFMRRLDRALDHPAPHQSAWTPRDVSELSLR